MDLETPTERKIDFLFKYIIIGDTGVGKSCLLQQYLKRECKLVLKAPSLVICSQLDRHEHDGRGIGCALRDSQLKDHQVADLGHCWAGEVQVSDSKLL